MLRKLLDSDKRQSQILPEIIEVRNKILNRILIFCMLPAIAAVISGALQAYRQNEWQFSTIYVSSYLLFLFAFITSKNTSYHIRAAAVVLGLYLFAVTALIRVGLSGEGIILLIICCFTGAILLDIRFGFVTTAFSSLTIIMVAAGITNNVIYIPPDFLQTS